MEIIKVNINEGKKKVVKYPSGVNLSILMDGDREGTNYLSEIVVKVEPGVLLKPCHSHKDIEEIIYVVKGRGKVWIEGETCEISEGDSVLFPANSKHTVKNTGKSALVLLCFFSSPNYRKKGLYLTYENVVLDKIMK